MKYKNIINAIFIERPNRFIAVCKIDEKVINVHVKNTSRCTELLVTGAEVFLEYNKSKSRKTDYTLITVKKGEKLFNLDSQIPNILAFNGIKNGTIILPNLNDEIFILKKEVKYKNSRFDIYGETISGIKFFLEVKGVTLEENGEVKFPGAPTIRGTKHVLELIEAKNEGYRSYVLFVIQVEGITYLKLYDEMDKKFAEALRYADKCGVNIIAYDCVVAPNEIEISKKVEVLL